MASTLTDDQLRERFVQLRDEWKSRSKYLSNTAQMAMLWPYQQIIGMGCDAIPMLLDELRHEPDQWFWALEAISGENPVPLNDAGDVQASAAAWIQWGRKQGLIR